MMITGKVLKGYKTKNLVKRLKPGDIALICHPDLDQIAGESLVESGVKAVINCSDSISGRYPNRGPGCLLEAGICLVDRCDKSLFSVINEGDIIQIKEGEIYRQGQYLGSGELLNKEIVDKNLKRARNNLKQELRKFIYNTLSYAQQEIDLILDLDVPRVDLENNHVLIVVRGAGYKEDLKLIRPYVREVHPIIIAVDGGADACLEYGYLPDIIIGDMDSVSDRALNCGSRLIVHAYADGSCPALNRLNSLGLEAKVFPAPGTSEDIALLLAYENGAELITAVGTHSNMIDFLEKGRNGMASTLLTRLKIGPKLVDARGISRIYQSRVPYRHWLGILVSFMIPLLVLAVSSPPINQYLRLLLIKISFWF